VFKERPTRKLTEQYVGPYMIEEVVLANTVKLKLLILKIYLVLNFSRVISVTNFI